MRIRIYKPIRNNKIIKSLTVNDITYWGSDSFINVIFALFVTSYINGATAADVGLAFMFMQSTSMLASIPIGQILDNYKGLRDETLGLALSGFLTGSLYILLSFATSRVELFVIMSLIGVSRALNMNSWRILFNKFLDKSHPGSVFGMYETLMAMSTGLLGALGGFVGEQYGFQIVVLAGGLLVFSGGLIPLLIRRDLNK